MENVIKQAGFNRKAYFDYTVEEKFECGVVLRGTEVKSIKDGKFSFSDSWAEIKDGEVWLKSFVISENPFSSVFNHEPGRAKKLLLRKQEIKRLTRKVEMKGYTLTPLSFYFKNGKFKVELGVCKGKKQFDKRSAIRERDLNIEAAREIRNRRPSRH
ncbi:MAG: SsrA-binding protein SmpB [Spirochaetaceae bacterium]|jgi:SsrA-binding protein|nr:SsrA-binding protein SmpB [Spirochaetaceae bacterium]